MGYRKRTYPLPDGWGTVGWGIVGRGAVCIKKNTGHREVAGVRVYQESELTVIKDCHQVNTRCIGMAYMDLPVTVIGVKVMR